MSTFKRNQKVYDRAGYEYFYQEPAETGHYVRKIVLIQTTHGASDDFDEIEEDGEIVRLDEVFGKPPVKKLNAEITALAEELTTAQLRLNKEVGAINRLKHEAETAFNRVKLDLEHELAAYPNYRRLLAVLSREEPNFSFSDDGFIVPKTGSGRVTVDIETGKMSLYDHNDEERFTCFDQEDEAQAYAKSVWPVEKFSTASEYHLIRIQKTFEAIRLPIPKELIDARRTHINKKIADAEKSAADQRQKLAALS